MEDCLGVGQYLYTAGHGFFFAQGSGDKHLSVVRRGAPRVVFV